MNDLENDRFPRHVAIHLALGFIAIVAFATVAMIATQVSAGSALAQLDETFAKFVDRNTTPGLHRVFRFVTLAGTGWATGIASAIVGVYLLLRRRFTLVIGWAIAQGGAVVVVKAIKAMVERTRPSVADATFYAHGWSFPSGHVVRTFTFCVMGVYVVYRLTSSKRATAIACGAAAAWSLAMACSRVYLGAHFASDVIAGLIVGTAWVAVCISVTEEGRRRSGPAA